MLVTPLATVCPSSAGITSIYETSNCPGEASSVIRHLADLTAADKKARITPRHIQLAIRNDEDINKLLYGVTISQGGVLPFIASELLKPPRGSKKAKQDWIRSNKGDMGVESYEGECCDVSLRADSG